MKEKHCNISKTWTITDNYIPLIQRAHTANMKAVKWNDTVWQRPPTDAYTFTCRCCLCWLLLIWMWLLFLASYSLYTHSIVCARKVQRLAARTLPQVENNEVFAAALCGLVYNLQAKTERVLAKDDIRGHGESEKRLVPMNHPRFGAFWVAIKTKVRQVLFWQMCSRSVLTAIIKLWCGTIG